MISFLRKKRKKLLQADSIGSYFKYALGEIVLVVIGILIALGINNWNTNRIKEKNLNNILTQMVSDLKNDTTEIRQIKELFEPMEPEYLLFVNDSITPEKLDSCQQCYYLITGYEPFIPNTSGYNLLKKFNSSLKTKRDSIIFRASNFYAHSTSIFELLNRNIENDVTDNFRYLKSNYSWYANWMNGIPNEELNNFILKDPLYRNMVTHFHLLLYGNFIRILDKHKQSAELLIKDLEEVIEPV